MHKMDFIYDYSFTRIVTMKEAKVTIRKEGMKEKRRIHRCIYLVSCVHCQSPPLLDSIWGFFFLSSDFSVYNADCSILLERIVKHKYK